MPFTLPEMCRKCSMIPDPGFMQDLVLGGERVCDTYFTCRSGGGGGGGLFMKLGCFLKIVSCHFSLDKRILGGENSCCGV